MLHTTYYLIQPNNALTAAFAQFDQDTQEYWLRPVLWSKGEPDRSRWIQADHIEHVKLLYVAYLKQDSAHLDEFQSVFGVLPVNIETFDRWWTVERHEVEENCSYIETQLTLSILEEIQPTGRPFIDQWLEWIKEQKD